MRLERRDGYVLLVGGPVPRGADAITIGSVISIRRDAVGSAYLLRHELVHVRQWVQQFIPTSEEAALRALVEAGDEDSLRQALELAPGEEFVIVPLAQLLVDSGRPEEALELLNRVPETEPVRHVAALARLAQKPADDYDAKLTSLLDDVKADEDARREYLDILEVMGPEDPRTATYRKQLTNRLF